MICIQKAAHQSAAFLLPGISFFSQWLFTDGKMCISLIQGKLYPPGFQGKYFRPHLVNRVNFAPSMASARITPTPAVATYRLTPKLSGFSHICDKLASIFKNRRRFQPACCFTAGKSDARRNLLQPVTGFTSVQRMQTKLTPIFSNGCV